MARPYSLDLRERVVAAVASGIACRAVAEAFGVSASAVVKWWQRLRTTGSAAAKKMGGHRRLVLAGERDWLVARVRAKPDITMRELAAELAERGIVVSHVSVWNLLRREKQTFKKTVRASEQDRPDVARRRARWKQHQAKIDPRRLVFIDETPDQVRGRLWVKTNMAPLRGWAPRGERLIAKVPHGHWRTLTFLAALRLDGVEAPCVFDGPINGESLRAYVEQTLLPTLKAADIVIMDNLGSHKGVAVRATIRSVGAKLLFLPAYSPDLNPIEQVFAKLKTLLRKARARSLEAVEAGIAGLITRFSSEECANYLKDAGYASI